MTKQWKKEQEFLQPHQTKEKKYLSCDRPYSMISRKQFMSVEQDVFFADFFFMVSFHENWRLRTIKIGSSREINMRFEIKNLDFISRLRDSTLGNLKRMAIN